MKILFITAAGGVDYQSDALFHGLVSLGHEVTDTKYLWYLSSLPDARKHRQYGRGYSIAGKLPDRSTVSRDPAEIARRIDDRDYDCVVYGSIWRSQDYIERVTKCYPRCRIAIVDGEDHTNLHPTRHDGVYFKRELVDNDKAIMPISFALPAEQYADVAGPADKTEDFAKLIPGYKSTYVYMTEKDYYDGYRRARFALTYRKSGWDCFRHYEIVAAGCLPVFTDIDCLPPRTMTTWPRRLQGRANLCAWRWMSGDRDDAEYASALSEFTSYARDRLTTTALASYFLERVMN